MAKYALIFHDDETTGALTVESGALTPESVNPWTTPEDQLTEAGKVFKAAVYVLNMTGVLSDGD